jgi:opacity protein-like surface antigen
MRCRFLVPSAVLLFLPLAGWPALAADLPNYPALSPSEAALAPDPWAGLYAGAGISVWGGKGIKGGVGGDGYIGYDKTFDNNVVVGFRGSSGYAPFTFATPRGLTPFTGTSFAGGEATVGYRIGQVTPYVITGLALARPTSYGAGAFSPGAALNDVFSGPGAVQAVGTVGIGAIYQVTPNLSMGIEARVSKVNGGATGWPY